MDNNNQPVSGDANVGNVVPMNNTVQTSTETSTTFESTTVNAPVEAMPVAQAVTTAPIVEKKSNNKMIIIIVVILLVLCCLCSSVFGYLYYVGKTAIDNANTDINTTIDDATGTFDKANSIIDKANDTIDKTIETQQKIIDNSTSGSTGSTFTNTPNFTKMPGTAICDQLLCSDIWYNIVPLADVYANCSDLSLKTTKLVSKSADSKTWKETWTLTGCGKDFDFGVDYTSPVGGGTDFAISKNF